MTDAMTEPARAGLFADLEGAIAPHLDLLYGADGPSVGADLLDAVAEFAADRPLEAQPARPVPDQATAVLITYADTVRRPGQAPLATLRETLDDLVGSCITDVHLLPLHPWTSDDGFSVVDYDVVDPALGTWDDVHALGGRRGLMLDFVANHLSAASPWVARWLARDPAYAHAFIERDPHFDTRATIRPRTSALFHDYPRPDGTVATAWTTFSADQLDLNFADPATFVRLTRVLLDFLAHGARMIRLDAIGFVWKASGTTSMSLPQTHAVVKVWRAICDAVAPGTQIVTETNVPALENLSYFGDGDDEAHLVYQFSLPPLVLHSFVAADASALTRWAASVTPPGPRATFLNFLASHDGIGLRGSEGILTDAERGALVARVQGNGGLVGLRALPDGGAGVYELNTTFLDALATPAELSDPANGPAAVAAKGLAAHAILLALSGVPAIYIHSLLGTPNDRAGALASGINRRISRPVLDADSLRDQLAGDARRSRMLDGMRHLLTVRGRCRAFDPYCPHEVLDLGPEVFAVRRRDPGGEPTVDCVTNVTGDPVRVRAHGTDLLTGRRVEGALTLEPYGYAWVAR